MSRKLKYYCNVCKAPTLHEENSIFGKCLKCNTKSLIEDDIEDTLDIDPYEKQKEIFFEEE